MVALRLVSMQEIEQVMEIIDLAKKYLKQQKIDQWQTGYPDYNCIKQDILHEKGFFLIDEHEILGYLCVDYDGEPAYDNLNGKWQTNTEYVVVHRMAFSDNARGRGMSTMAFHLVEEMSKRIGIHAFRVDTDAENQRMLHILKKNGFSYRGVICFDNSEKIAFDKIIK